MKNTTKNFRSVFFFYSKQYETLSYATQSENIILNIKILFSKEKSSCVRINFIEEYILQY